LIDRKKLLLKRQEIIEMLWGGWTCPKCGMEIDGWGNVIRVGERR